MKQKSKVKTKDGKETYKTKVMKMWKGRKAIWTIENMRHIPSNNKINFYKNNKENKKEYWALYDWETAQLLPKTLEGGWWELPSKNDWEMLIEHNGGVKKAWWLWNRLGWVISSLPGTLGSDGDVFFIKDKSAVWWSSNRLYPFAMTGYSLNYKTKEVKEILLTKKIACSVVCIKKIPGYKEAKNMENT